MGQAGSRGPGEVLPPRPDQHGFCSWAHGVWLSSGDYSLPIRKEYEPHPSLCVHTEGPAAFAAHLEMAVWTVISCQKCCCPGKDRPITLWALGISGTYCQDFWGVNGPAPQRSVLLRLGTATFPLSFLSLFCHVTNTTTERTSQGDCWEGLRRLRRA